MATPPPSDPEREKHLRRAFTLPVNPRFGELRLRPFALWTLDFCDELGLGFFVDPDKRDEPPPIHLSKAEQFSALIWGHWTGVSEEEVDDHLFLGTWPAELRTFHRSEALGRQSEQLMQYVGYIAALINAATVKIRKRKLEKGEKRVEDPKDVLNPAGRAALIWSVSGGQVQSADQHHYMYRGMPLPVLLQYYHAACREAQLLTVAPFQADPKRLREAREKAQAAAKVADAKVAVDVDFF